MPAYEEIFEKVQSTLVDALGVDEEDVTRESTLQGDLGAESIDFLDISFQLEKKFNLKFSREELFPDQSFAGNETYLKDGVVTPEGITALRQKLPHANIDKFAADPTVENINDLITVNSVVNFMERKLAG